MQPWKEKTAEEEDTKLADYAKTAISVALPILEHRIGFLTPIKSENIAAREAAFGSAYYGWGKIRYERLPD